MTQSAERLPPSLIEKLKATLTQEELSLVMSAAPMAEIKTEDLSEPDRVYIELRKTFRPDLETSVVSRQEAAEKYPIDYATIAYWEKKGIIRVIEKAPRRGMPSKISERDVAIMAEMNRLFRKDGGRSGPIKGWNPTKVA